MYLPSPEPTIPPRRSIRLSICHYGTVAVLLTGYWVAAVTAMKNKSATFDEAAFLTGGYCYWINDDYRLSPNCDNLPQRWASLPALIERPAFPTLDQPAWREADVWRLGEQFLYGVGNDADALLLRGRAMVAMLGVALGLVVYSWARSLFGPASGLLSLALYAFSPTMLAHGAVTTADLMVSLFFTVSVWCIWIVMHRATAGRVLLSALAMAGLVLSKFSGVLIVPVVLILLAIRLAGGRPMAIQFRREHRVTSRVQQLGAMCAILLIHAVIVWAAIWASFGFRYTPYRDMPVGNEQMPAAWPAAIEDPGPIGAVVRFARERRVLPEAYLYGFAHTMRFTAQRNSFFNGEFSIHGSPWFFPYSFLVKTPLGLFGLLAAAQIAGRFLPRTRLYELWPLAVFLCVYWVVAIRANVNIGHRHILPIYPPVFILAGAAAHWLSKPTGSVFASGSYGIGRRRILAGLVLALSLSFVAESLLIRPHYLAYFNFLAGGPSQGYRHLVDSSLDWGQDLPGVSDWLKSHPAKQPDQPAYLSYFGTARPEHYGITAEALPGFFDRRTPHHPKPLRPGVYLISATMLQAVYLKAPGPWTLRYETAYRDLGAFLRDVEQANLDPAARSALVRKVPEAQWDAMFQMFEHLRFGRLCAVLRRRRPDDQIGYSILVFRVNEAELRAALDGPAPLEAQRATP